MKGKKLDEEICQQIVNLWMNYNYSQQKIADTLGVGYSTVRRTISEYTEDGSHTPPKGMLPPPAQFNEDFEDTITEAPEEIEQAAEPTTVTEERTVEPIPDAVMQAVIDKIVKLSDTLSDNLLTVKKIQQENEQIRSELAVLYGWRAEHEGTPD